MASTRKTLRAINLFLTPPPLSLALANNPFPLRRPPPRIPHSSSHYPPTHCARTMSKSRRTVSHSPSSLHALLHQLAWGEATEANPPREQSAQGDYWGGKGECKRKGRGFRGWVRQRGRRTRRRVCHYYYYNCGVCGGSSKKYTSSCCGSFGVSFGLPLLAVVVVVKWAHFLLGGVPKRTAKQQEPSIFLPGLVLAPVAILLH